MATDIPPAFPMVNIYQARWPSRYPSLWLLPALTRLKHGDDMIPKIDSEYALEMQSYFVDAIIEDLSNSPPDLVFIDISKNKNFFNKIPFDYLDFFIQYPDFVDFWSDYEYQTEINIVLPWRWSRPYQVYRRRIN